MVVETEGGFPTMNTDFLSVFDHIFRHEFDYQRRFIHPRFMVPSYQKVVRRMASPRHLPDKPRSFSPLEKVATDVLIVGHGLSGTAATDRLRRRGLSPIIADRHGTDVFPPTIAFGFYEDGRVGLLTETGGMLVKAKAVLLATGRVETGVAVANADLPGVMLPEAVEHLVSRGVRPGSRAFLIGDNELKGNVQKHLANANCEVAGESTDPRNVVRIAGGKMVRSVETKAADGRLQRVPCDLVVLLGPLVPYVPLAQQAGCELRADGEYWCVKVEENGSTSIPHVFAYGSVTGITSEDGRAMSGERVASGVADSLGVS